MITGPAAHFIVGKSVAGKKSRNRMLALFGNISLGSLEPEIFVASEHVTDPELLAFVHAGGKNIFRMSPPVERHED